MMVSFLFLYCMGSGGGGTWLLVFSDRGLLPEVEPTSDELHFTLSHERNCIIFNLSLSLCVMYYFFSPPPPTHPPPPQHPSTRLLLPPPSSLPLPLSLSIFSALTSSQSALTRRSRKITSPLFRFSSALPLPRKSNIAWKTHRDRSQREEQKKKKKKTETLQTDREKKRRWKQTGRTAAEGGNEGKNMTLKRWKIWGEMIQEWKVINKKTFLFKIKLL